jgi:hypothetical protein
MKIKTNTSLAGVDFSYRFGEIVDRDEFAGKVGSGWEALCEEVPEAAVKPAAPETADAPQVRQKAVKATSKETR